MKPCAKKKEEFVMQQAVKVIAINKFKKRLNKELEEKPTEVTK